MQTQAVAEMAMPALLRRRTFRRWWVAAGPVFKIASNDVFGLTSKQLAEWDQWLTERRPRTRIHLEDTPK